MVGDADVGSPLVTPNEPPDSHRAAHTSPLAAPQPSTSSDATAPLPPPPARPPPPPPPPPPTLSYGTADERWPTLAETRSLTSVDIPIDATTSNTPFDATEEQPDPAVRRRARPLSSARPLSRYVTEESFQNLRGNLTALFVAGLLALPFALGAFLGVFAVRFAFDDRTFWNSQAHSLAQFWYALLLFVSSALPVTFILIRRGQREAVRFVVDRGYWKILFTVVVVLPLAVGLIAFVASHLVAVLIVIVILLILIAVGGGF